MQFTLPQLEPQAASVGGASAAEQAAAIVAAARAEAARIGEAAAREGRAAGFEAGREEARNVLEEAARAVFDAREELAALAELRAAELAVELAEKIVAASLEVRPELVLDSCRALLRRVVRRDGLVLEVNPDDLEIVRGGLGDLAAVLGDLGRIEVVAERRVERGACLLRTAEGELDTNHAGQLDRARELIVAALR